MNTMNMLKKLTVATTVALSVMISPLKAMDSKEIGEFLKKFPLEITYSAKDRETFAMMRTPSTQDQINCQIADSFPEIILKKRRKTSQVAHNPDLRRQYLQDRFPNLPFSEEAIKDLEKLPLGDWTKFLRHTISKCLDVFKIDQEESPLSIEPERRFEVLNKRINRLLPKYSFTKTDKDYFQEELPKFSPEEWKQVLEKVEDKTLPSTVIDEVALAKVTYVLTYHTEPTTKDEKPAFSEYLELLTIQGDDNE